MQLLSVLAWWRPSSVAISTLVQDSLNQECMPASFSGSKAFDMINHHVLFDNLLSSGMPKALIHLLLQWYKSQQLCVRWMSRSSSYFQVSNWGGVPSLFSSWYIIMPLDSLRISQGHAEAAINHSLCWCLLLCRWSDYPCSIPWCS